MDGLSLGLQSYKFDLTLSIAVIHHMTTYEQRVKMVKELEKVTSNDGRIVISVFGYEQKKDIYQNQDILLQYCVPMHKSNSN
jgi:2-polyprenyl-3-methyl-5-hydroxy-6-metoxy-1,4-benzoquinol methylase